MIKHAETKVTSGGASLKGKDGQDKHYVGKDKIENTGAFKILVYDLFRSSSKRHLRWNQVARLNTLLAPITFSNIFHGFFS